MNFGSHFRDALRLLSWRRPVDPGAILSPLSIFAIGLTLFALNIGVQWAVAGKYAYFQMYGVNAELAWLAVGFTVIILFSRFDVTGATLRNLTLLSAGVCALSTLIVLAIDRLAGKLPSGVASALILFAFLLPLFLLAWSAGGARQAFKSVATVRRPALRGLAFAACFWIAAVAMPSWPVFVGENFKRSFANYWELAASIRRSTTRPEGNEAKATNDAAMIEAAQPARLEAALAKLERRAPKKNNIFVIGVAGWSEQDVFIRETQQSLEILKDRMSIGNRTISLVNNAKGAEAPIANIQNLAYIFRGVAARMDLEKDILILTMTSHGSPAGFALEFESMVDRTLQPQVLKDMLDAAGFKNRIIIVSSCYSGAFVPTLADSRTMIVTAASAKRTSFGCANDRNWTYFGEAFFERGLREEPSLGGAFEKAKKLITKWEDEQHLTPSEPQIFVGAELQRRFASLIGTQTTTQAWMSTQKAAENIPVEER